MKYDEIITDYPCDQLTLGKLKGLLDTINLDDDTLVESIHLKASSNSIYLSSNEEGYLVMGD